LSEHAFSVKSMTMVLATGLFEKLDLLVKDALGCRPISLQTRNTA
jgi:hypothetical protein